jgi:type VI secretion system secreted protein VgrG
VAPAYTQAGRPIRVTTPLAADTLLLERVECEEAVSEQFEMILHLLSTDATIDRKKLLRQPVTVTVDLAAGGTRFFHGIVKRFVQLGKADGLVSYRAEVVPKTWLLSLATDCRIFQNKSVPDIVKQILGDAGITDFRLNLTGQYSPREYCVQYRETQLDFISRLMEEEGIFYFFEHAKDKHTLVLADAPSAVKPGSSSKLAMNMTPSGPSDDMILSLEVDSEVMSGKVTLVDYNDTTVKRFESTVAANPQGTGDEKLRRFDYPGKFAAVGEGDRLARLRMEEAESLGVMVRGTTSYRGLSSGQKLEITDHYRKDVNVAYHVLSASHAGDDGSYRSGDEGAFSFETSFEAIPHGVPYRPARVTPKAVVHGTQPAVVVGPAGEEIYVDNFGRVKVQFFWDQLGKKDDKSSCWVRVSTAWAGKQWGFITLPRIGQEVIVDFLEGDPDRPIVVGRVYNGEQMPPFALPANSSQSGMVSRSTKTGGAANFNQLRFEDKKGSEQILLHAEKNQDIEVENDETHWVGHDRKKTIDNDETTLVKHDRIETVNNNETITVHGMRTETVDKDETLTVTGKRVETITGDDTLTIKDGDAKHTVQSGKYAFTVKGNRDVVVQDGNDSTKVQKGNQSTEIGMGNMQSQVKMGNVTMKVDLGKISYESMAGIELKVGANSIKIDQSGVTIKGLKVSVEGSVMTEVKAPLTTVKADGIMTVKGAITMIN